ERLREQILSGELEPGAELAEVALSEQLGVSRGPVREALGRLASEGLVIVRPRRGAVVRSLSKEEFLELYQVREALEMMAVRLAVPRLSKDDLEDLQRLNQTMARHAERDEVARFFEANLAFHDRLLEASGNTTLQELSRPLIAPDYDVQMLLDLSRTVEEAGFDSVWVGDSLFSKPRYEPISLLSAISQRTSGVRLGTACMVTSTRDPLYLALEWATLDVISGGRTIFGTGMGNPEECVRREFALPGLDYVSGGT